MVTPKDGPDTLAEIRQEFEAERARLRDIDGRLASANERIVEVDAARAKQLESLARVRLGGPAQAAAPDGDEAARGDAAARGEGDSPAAGAVPPDDLDDLDARVAAMLTARRTDRAELEATLRDLDADTTRAEQRRAELTDALEAANEALDAAEAATQERLEDDPDYRARRERAHELRATAHHADEKATQSEEERAEKGRAYEDDPFFMYLWRRGFGTDRYGAWPLTRYLDRAIARMIGYDGARVNYARLIELPKRLREHAERLATAAEEALAGLRRRDEEARAEDGIDDLERERDEARAALDAHGAAAAEAAEDRQATFERLERMDRGEDEAYAETIGILASQLQREDLRDLRQQAIATPDPDDDAIIARLLELEDERARLAERVEDLKEVAASSRERLRELQDLHSEFLERHHGGPGSEYADGDLVGTVLEQVLRGVTGRGVLWRVLDEQLRGPERRSDPSFGSGGFGKGSPWGSGGTGTFGGGLSGGGFSGGGSMRGGGFQTGGSMRGGGFRTGGKR